MEAIEEKKVTSWGWPPGKVAMLVRHAVRLVLFLGLLFGAAGSLYWVPGWVFVAVTVGGGLLLYAYVERTQPGLMKRRTRIGSNTKRWDKVFLGVYFAFYFAILAVGALDAGRFGWDPLPAWSTWVGVAVLVTSYVLFAWAMGHNRHFEATVRIQHDLEHRVIDTGPYGIVRHPGYVGGLLAVVGSALVLQSWIALLPGAVAGIAMVVRTWAEDRTLRRELEGYAAYAERVRYRLLPGLW